MAIADNMPNDRPQDQARRIADLERAVRELRAARSLDQGTITATAGLGVRTSNFDGTDFAHPGTQGNYFGGDGLVANELYLRPGSVSNDALTNPVVPGVANVNTDTFSLTNSFAEKVGINLTVPDGCTKLLATCSVWLQAFNTNTTGGSNGAGADYIYAYAKAGSTSGDYKATGISGNNGTASTAAGLSTLLTSLTPGGTVRLGGWCSSQYTTIASSANNRVTLSASLIWLR